VKHLTKILIKTEKICLGIAVIRGIFRQVF